MCDYHVPTNEHETKHNWYNSSSQVSFSNPTSPFSWRLPSILNLVLTIPMHRLIILLYKYLSINNAEYWVTRFLTSYQCYRIVCILLQPALMAQQYIYETWMWIKLALGHSLSQLYFIPLYGYTPLHLFSFLLKILRLILTVFCFLAI